MGVVDGIRLLPEAVEQDQVRLEAEEGLVALEDAVGVVAAGAAEVVDVGVVVLEAGDEVDVEVLRERSARTCRRRR